MEKIGSFKFAGSDAKADSQNSAGCERRRLDGANAFNACSVYGAENLELVPFSVDDYPAEESFTAIKFFSNKPVRASEIVQ